ncbi:riboflavin biosynthesis protein RibD [Acinetobacter nectaris CIP 110549]|uniref:Riboflavin biosynthesis protein RibD n=1 Tax=Acinetobacter nectaris CIP 110549 TaxID=1392540 RepID=V2TM40_9GAMM|nr:bifunctional diaminohydroxyphosphoribosylaminopyrimidine deaminase/5-amino-6-(5-phosphoribosylamino)uracil reductase RibD [Acinetobacter nectaris]ESK38417.1 riboflavin biosynthesis protein RibD [Acinetobacter nectaris CIP 110549]
MSNLFSEQDQIYMRQAIALAQKAIYSTKPNPNVGCVIVKNGEVIGQGFHPKAGQPHAEVFALREAGSHANGATAYVTLEPCAHYGRTPPCAEALVKAGVKQVFIANTDPNPLVAGKGISILEAAGIQVQTGLCEYEARVLNEGFLKKMATGLPYVRLKVASSLDGRTAMASGESKWITGQEARQDVQHWRAISGAVITGIETVLADDCQLNVRQLSNVELDAIVQPKRIVLDRQGRLPLTAKILENPQNTWVMAPYRQELADLGVLQFKVQPLQSLLKIIAQKYSIHDVLVETGATLSTSFLTEQLVDEMIHYVAPTLLGQSARAMFQADFSSLSQQQRFTVKDITQLGDDFRFRLIPVQESL